MDAGQKKPKYQKVNKMQRQKEKIHMEWEEHILHVSID